MQMQLVTSHIQVLTRPDNAYVVNVVSRFMAQPRREHWKAIKQIFRYLNGSMSYDLMYKGSKGDSNDLQGYIDSDFIGSLDRKMSFTGYVFML